MFIRLFLALLVLIGVMWFMSWYGKASPGRRNKAIKTGLLYIVAGALLLLVVTGRIPVIFAAISAAVPILHRLLAYRGLLGTIGRFAGEKFGPTRFTTLWLVVEYDMARRALDGNIIRGQFEGRMLSQLSVLELDELLQEVKGDFQSRAAVNAFIMARNGQSYKQNTQPPPSVDGKMSPSQAYEILDLKADASNDEVKQAHKRLMQKLHPDRGGSSYLAAQINAAKDTLLNRHA
jgi:hypothetical protein